MNHRIQSHKTNTLEHAMAEYVINAAIEKYKHKKLRLNMEIRRKLEIKLEERLLQSAIADFYFQE